ncbi:MAG: DNA translocase FtsK 4TM domain-containing protein, partial [Oscillospiraceae bacterium]|nr:DNA translocase FtsK 4TM domain-containing protein [Oscillospiraceae bacterium]
MATASDNKKKTSSGKSSSSSGSKKTTGGSKSSAGKGASSGSGTRSSSSSGSRSAASQSSGKSSGGQHEAPKETKQPIRREVWAIAFFLIGLLSLLGYFGADSIFHKIFCTPLKGLMGYGYYVFPPAMFVCFAILMFHKARPVRLRTYLTIAIPFCVGALTHIISGGTLDFGSLGSSLGSLYASGISLSSGGVLCGLIGSGLSALISSVGAVLVLIVLLIIAIAVVFKISPSKIAENVRTRERPQYIPEPEPEQTEKKTAPAKTAAASAPTGREPEYVAVPNPETRTILPHAPVKPPRKLKTVDDGPVIDVPLDGDETAREPKKKAGFFNNTPNVKTPASVLPPHTGEPAAQTAPEEEHMDIPIFDDEPELTEDPVPTYTFPVSRPAAARPAAADTLPHIPAAPAITFKSPNVATPLSIEDAAKIAGVSPELTEKPAKDELFPSDRPRYAGQEDNTPAPEKTPVLSPLGEDEPHNAKLGAKELQKETELIGIEAEKAVASAPEAYVYPPIELLAEGKVSSGESASQLRFYAESLSSTLHSFGVNAKVVDTISGPTVTRYDLQLEAGVKLSRITGLSDDIALALGVSGVRIAPIPGKAATVGVEVPNSSVSTVYLRSLVDSGTFREAKSRLTFAIGKDIGGNTVVGNTSKLPH